MIAKGRSPRVRKGRSRGRTRTFISEYGDQAMTVVSMTMAYPSSSPRHHTHHPHGTVLIIPTASYNMQPIIARLPCSLWIVHGMSAVCCKKNKSSRHSALPALTAPTTTGHRSTAKLSIGQWAAIMGKHSTRITPAQPHSEESKDGDPGV